MRQLSPWSYLLLMLWVLLCCWPVSAQPTTTSNDSPQSIETALDNLQSNLKLLKTKLAERSIALSEAKRQLTELRSELERLQTHLIASRLEIERLTQSLTLSRQMYDELQNIFEEYQMEAEDAIRRARILWGSVGLFVGAVLALVFAL